MEHVTVWFIFVACYLNQPQAGITDYLLTSLVHQENVMYSFEEFTKVNLNAKIKQK